MTKMDELADLCGRAAIEHRKLVFAKHEGKSPEEVRAIEDNLYKLRTEMKEIQETLEKYEDKKGDSLD